MDPQPQLSADALLEQLRSQFETLCRAVADAVNQALRARSSTPARRRSATCSPPSDATPPRPPCSSDWRPRKRLPPPPQHPTTGKRLQNKGPEEHSVLTVNGRLRLFRRRSFARDVGSTTPLDAWLDRAESTSSLASISTEPDPPVISSPFLPVFRCGSAGALWAVYEIRSQPPALSSF
jgi:hypothetical protein